jgi:hypothetical protein
MAEGLELPEYKHLFVGFYICIYRAFRRAFSSPLEATLEVSLAFLYLYSTTRTVQSNSLNGPGFESFYLFFILAQFVVYRAATFLNKLTYVIISFITAFKNKKQRIAH